jgi:tetratricopeptide (TPR) repeat protein
MKRLLLAGTMLLATESWLWAQPKPAASPSSTAAPTAGSGAKPFLSTVKKIVTGDVPSPTPPKWVSNARSSPSPSASRSPSASPSASAKKDAIKIRYRPTKDGVETPFDDVPWALHVPVEVPFEGGAARVSWQLRVSWENPPQEWYQQTRNIGIAGRGIYRADGKQPAKDSVRRRGAPLEWETDVPLPTLAWGVSDRGIESEKEKHKPMSGLVDDALVIEPVEPGWYTLWFALDSTGWPVKEPKREFIQGVIHVDTMVSRGKEEPLSTEQEYLFGRGKRPDKMQEDKFYKVRTIDVPFKLRRNGWEFDHIEVKVKEDEQEKLQKKRLGSEKYHWYRTYAVTEKVSGKEVELSVNEKFQADPRGETTDAAIPDNDQLFDTVYLMESKWKASFPQSIPVNSFGTVKFTGSEQARFQQKKQFASKPDPTYHWEPSGTYQLYADNGVGHYQRTERNPLEKRFEEHQKEALAEFVNTHGKDAAEFFVPDYFEDPRFAPKQGEPPLSYVIKASRHVPKDAAPLELGPYPLLVFGVGPWEIWGYYKRTSEVEDRTVASTGTTGDSTLVSDADDFWKWYPGLSAVIAAQKVKADGAVAAAALETVPIQQLLRSQRRLLASLMKDPNSPGVLESMAGWLDDAFPKTGIGTLPGGSEPGSVNTPVERSAEQTTAIRNKLGQITEDIRHARERIADRTAEAKDCYQKILDKLEEGNEKYGGPAHGELYNWRQHYRKIFERIALDIAMASRDPVILKKALVEAESEGHGAGTRILEAQLQMVLGDSVGALSSLRSAVAVSKSAGNTAKPSEEESMALLMLRDLECAFLKNAIDKSQGAIQAARKAFYGYMMERGFSDHELRQTSVTTRDDKTLDMPLARAIAATEYTLSKDGETAWAILTTGLFGSMSALVDKEGGKPAAEADLLATTEKQMTTAFIGLNSILRLRGNGYTFEEIQKMNSMDIRERLPLRNLKGELYSDQQAALHAVAIREAMKLPDIQALISGDPLALKLGLEKKYWNSKDVGDTWIEWIGDATSMYNLFLLLPGAKAGEVGRSFVFWGSGEIRAIEALEKSGAVITGTEAIANTIGLTQFLGAAGATETGKVILGYVKQIGRYEESLKWYDKVIWTTGKLTGMLTINFTTVIATEKLFGHKAAMLMQAALMFGSDPETLVKLLDAQNIPKKKIAELIINDYLPATQVHLKRLAQIEKTSKELELLFERVKTKRLDANDIMFLDKYFEKADWRRLIPNGQASHDSSIALAAAGEGARNGVDNGAGKAVSEKLKEARQAEMVETTKAAEQAKQIVNKLEGASPPVRGPPPPVQPPTPPRNLQRATFVELRAANELGGYPLPPRPRPGSECAKAEALLHLGKYHEAQAQYEEIIERILKPTHEKGQLFIADEMPLEYIHLKRCLAYDLQGVTRKPATNVAKAVSRPIPAEDVERILSNPDLWQGNPEQGAMGNVYAINGDAEYLVKTVAHKTEKEINGTMVTVRQLDVLADVEANLAHVELGRALGFDVPAMEVRLVRNPANGQVEKAFYVMRRAKGGRLSDLSAGEIFLFKDELSKHRALATLLGDWDRKIDNYMVVEGRLVPIDAGLADITGKRVTDAGFAVDEAFTMEGQAGRDHWLSRFFKDEMCGKDSAGNPLGKNAPRVELWEPSEKFARKGLVAEEALTYQAAKPTVDEIIKLVDPANEEGLRKLLEDAFMKVHGNEVEIERLTKRLIDGKKAMGEVVDLAKPGVKEALRSNVLEAIKLTIKPKVEDSINFLRTRAKKLDKCMRGLNERSATPLASRRRQLDPFDDDMLSRVALFHIFKTVSLRRAA